MSLERWFRLLQYVTLGLSCTALVLAEEPFLPDLQLCLAPMLALLLLAWWVEGRWYLPNRGADILGLLIAAAGITWLVKQLSDDDFVLAHLPLHLALLPYMGPLAMACLLVKVFRRRDAGHFWHVQGFALMQIALGCVLDGGPDFGVTTAAYIVSAVACLALHYRLSARRAGSVSCHVGEPAALAAGCLFHPAANAAGSPSATRRWLVSFTLGWVLLISAPALLLFLLTPRRDNWSWQPLNRMRSGFSRGRLQSDSEEMNLNSIGRIDLDDEIAFSIEAIDAAGRPKLDLPVDQRWRGSVLDWYEHGKWATRNLRPAGPSRRRDQADLPDFGPDQFFLDFTVQPRQAGGLVLADPIRFGRFWTRLPVITLAGAGRQRLFAEVSGTVLPQVLADGRHEYRYRQAMPGRGDPSRTAAGGLRSDKELSDLTSVPASIQELLQDWTLDLLRRLSEDKRYRLPQGVAAVLAKPHPVSPLDADHWEAVARVLTDYLAHSGEYTYTLQLTRHDRSIDPVLDFLLNVKQGHCERYAAALALTLRSVGVPARVVKGFRGWGSQGNGQYVVRHSHAHAWVEILVPRGAPAASAAGWGAKFTRQLPLPGRRAPLEWLTLDATPAELAAAEHSSSLAYLWDEIHRYCLQWWRSLIVEYNGDEQADLWDTLKSGRPLLGVLQKMGLAVLAFATVLAAWLLLRRLRRRSIPVRSDGAIYSRLVRILGRYASLRPALGQTPREYGSTAQAFLQTRPALAALSDLPTRAIELFYRVRFGGQPLREEERQEIDTKLDHFTQALQLSGRNAKSSA